MKIAIISDIHDNLHNLVLFLEEIKKLKIEKIICLGDLINNGIAKTLANSKIPVFSIWGNNDGDKVAIMQTSLAKDSNLKMSFDSFDIIEIDKRRIFLTHYPLIVDSIAKSGDFDAVFYGHTHKKDLRQIQDCLILNPGELGGISTKEAHFAIYDTKTNSVEIIKINSAISNQTEKSEKYFQKIIKKQ